MMMQLLKLLLMIVVLLASSVFLFDYGKSRTDQPWTCELVDHQPWESVAVEGFCIRCGAHLFTPRD